MRNYYYVQGLGDQNGGFKSEATIIFAENVKELRPKALQWQREVRVEKLNFYRNNYKREAEEMVAVGNCR